MTWLQVIPYFPTVLTFGAVSVAFIDVDMGVAESIASNNGIFYFSYYLFTGELFVLHYVALVFSRRYLSGAVL